MKVLLVTWVDPWTRNVATIHKWLEAGRILGHEVVIFGPPNKDLPKLTFTTDLTNVDIALFVAQLPLDFPDMPYLARLLDGVPRERRMVLDMWARYDETIRIEHDFNHLEKFDGHLGWEWQDAFSAFSATVLQPTLTPRRADVQSFLFHGFDVGSVAKPYASAREAAAAWTAKPYGVMYAGSNWQRWDQMRSVLEAHASVRSDIGPACLIGWDWRARPEWAVKNGIMGIDTDPDLLARLEVEVRDGVRFDAIVDLLGQARFTPVLHRPLFRHLGLVTNRTFETFYADTIPVLMLPRELVSSIYGAAASRLVPEGDLAAHLTEVIRAPEPYWDAVFETRAHLAEHHSYARRFEQLGKLAAAQRAPGALR
jgi:hypothetical protein